MANDGVILGDGRNSEMNQPQEGLLVRAALLPEDVLADILGRVAPRGLAVARAVCREWRAAVDGHRLLRADLLPLSVGGIFVNFRSHSFPEYFSRPSSGPSVSGQMDDYLPLARTIVSGHCNGLLLLNVRDHGDYVVNPATRAWAPVPPPPPAPAFGAGVPPDIFSYRNHLVFDPTLSPDYEVVSVPHVKYFDVDSPLHPAVAGAEWPPPRCILRVFSSKTNRWEERSFVRQGGAEATILGMHHEVVQLPYSTYSRGALYAFCKAYFVMRISLTHNRYQVIKSPASYETRESIDLYLGKSKNGVYLASYHHGQDLLQVWVLDESGDQMEWLLTHKCRLLYNVLCQNCNHQPSGPWVLHDVNYNLFRDCFPDNIKDALIEEKYEWDSDNDNVLDNEDRAERRHYCGSLSILGFHPFKEVIFLNLSQKRGLAYHWKSSKVQDLGDMYPTEYEYFAEMWPDIDVSFPCTPCWTYVRGLTEVANLEAHGSPC